MQNIVIDRPYRFVAPRESSFWPLILRRYARRYIRKAWGVTDVRVQHAERLKASIDAGHGTLLTPNHCRDSDPMALYALSSAVGRPFYLMASWHLFNQGRLQAFLLNRAGAFSVYREGMDKSAVNAAIEILEQARRPLVLFPEGVVSRTNDRLLALLEGTSLIARSAARKREKQTPPGKVVIHPIAIRYTFAGDSKALEATIRPVLSEIEHRLSWAQRPDLSLADRIVRIGHGLLALKEIEYLGAAQSGDIGQRLERLVDAILVPLEQQWADGRREAHPVARVKRLRASILPDLIKGEIAEDQRQDRWRQLAEIYTAQAIAHYPPDYIRSKATPERLLETVERFEEDLTDYVRPHPPIHAMITVGEAIEVRATREREARGEGDALMVTLERRLKELLGIPAEAPAAPPDEQSPPAEVSVTA
jgi:1-acyl-sn-glycerol-3-phosphate acyltransferase